MKERLIVAAVGIPLTAVVVWFAPDWLFMVIVAAAGVICVAELLKASRKAYAFIVSILILFSFVTLIKFRSEFGAVLALLLFGCTYISDGGAMLAGKFFGKRHPFPNVSPNKTEMGVVGGLIAPVLLALVFSFLGAVDAPIAAAAGFIIGLSAELGDLFFSFIKRKIGIKDYGNILPGHGGMLDRFDSMVFVTPAAYLLFTLAVIL